MVNSFIFDSGARHSDWYGGMYGAHHWPGILISIGYEVKIIPPQFVKPFVKSNKNDVNDAQAI